MKTSAWLLFFSQISADRLQQTHKQQGSLMSFRTQKGYHHAVCRSGSRNKFQIRSLISTWHIKMLFYSIQCEDCSEHKTGTGEVIKFIIKEWVLIKWHLELCRKEWGEIVHFVLWNFFNIILKTSRPHKFACFSFFMYANLMLLKIYICAIFNLFFIAFTQVELLVFQYFMTLFFAKKVLAKKEKPTVEAFLPGDENK